MDRANWRSVVGWWLAPTGIALGFASAAAVWLTPTQSEWSWDLTTDDVAVLAGSVIIGVLPSMMVGVLLASRRTRLVGAVALVPLTGLLALLALACAGQLMSCRTEIGACVASRTVVLGSVGVIIAVCGAGGATQWFVQRRAERHGSEPRRLGT